MQEEFHQIRRKTFSPCPLPIRLLLQYMQILERGTVVNFRILRTVEKVGFSHLGDKTRKGNEEREKCYDSYAI